MAAAAPAVGQCSIPKATPAAIPHPIFFAAIAYAGGVAGTKLAAGFGQWTPPNWEIVAAAMLMTLGALAIILRAHVQIACASAFLSLALLGAAQFSLGPTYSFRPFSAQLENQAVTIDGFVTRASLPVLERALDNGAAEPAPEGYQQLDLAVDRLAREDEPATEIQQLGVRVSVYDPDPQSDLSELLVRSRGAFHYGQRLRVRGRIRSPQVFGDPGVFDRRAYLQEQGIAAVMNAKAAEVRVLPGMAGTRLGRWRAETRESLLTHILALHSDAATNWPLFAISRSDAGLLAAMILGERSLLDQRVKADFQRTGSYHLLVVSGMAVAILAFALFSICRLCRMPEIAATILSVIFIGLYVSLTDLGAPVQLAALMCGVYMLARLFYRERDVLNAIGFAALAALVIDPASLFDAGSR